MLRASQNLIFEQPRGYWFWIPDPSCLCWACCCCYCYDEIATIVVLGSEDALIVPFRSSEMMQDEKKKNTSSRGIFGEYNLLLAVSVGMRKGRPVAVEHCRRLSCTSIFLWPSSSIPSTISSFDRRWIHRCVCPACHLPSRKGEDFFHYYVNDLFFGFIQMKVGIFCYKIP